jgi:hypothetical protein
MRECVGQGAGGAHALQDEECWGDCQYFFDGETGPTGQRNLATGKLETA